jgi:hypothetical protein
LIDHHHVDGPVLVKVLEPGAFETLDECARVLWGHKPDAGELPIRTHRRVRNLRCERRCSASVSSDDGAALNDNGDSLDEHSHD